jgi:membrane-associated phospholipid phosphatase
MKLGFVICFTTVMGAVSPCAGQDTTSTDSLHRSSSDSTSGRLGRIGRKSLLLAERTEGLVFGVDSAVALWSRHNDPASRALRTLAPVAFWVPIATVSAVPVFWADESQDGHSLNAAYARNTAAALTLGFIASRTAKHFIHRARPCTGDGPDVISVGTLADSLPQCPAGSHVSAYSSFFSEHTMALFAIASATTFQAQRRNAPNAATVAAVGFTSATVFSIARIYQRHHWLSDVLVGAAVGTASGFAAAQLAPASPRR